jgi:hypothetical protein
MKKSIQQCNIFLVHAHSDREIVHKLYTRLIKDGVNVWLDAEKLQPGQDWQNEIRKAILKSDIVLVCLSQHFNQQQGFRHEELKIALEKAKWIVDEVFIIPVRLEKCDMPESLCHLHRVDLFETGGYKKLILALHQQAESRNK